MSNQGLYCVKARKDSQAWSIYKHLQRHYQQSEKDFDKGFIETYFHQGPTPVQKLVSVENGVVCSQEVYDRAIHLAEKNPKIAEWLKAKKKIEIPWINLGPELKNKFLNYFEKEKLEIEKKKLSDTDRSIARAEAIDRFIRDAEVGLGIRYDYDKKTKVRTPKESANDQLANCLDYVILFKALAKIANEKINILYATKSKSGEEINNINHLVVGVEKKSGENKSFTIFDIDPRSKTLPLIETFPISSRVLLSLIFSNQASLNNPFDGETEISKFTTFAVKYHIFGLKIDPENPFVLDKLIHVLGNAHQIKRALYLSQKLVKRYPTYPEGLLSLARVYKELGNYPLALKAIKNYEALQK